MSYETVALCMSSVAHITPASHLCPSPAHQGQREVLRPQLNPDIFIYIFCSTLSFHLFSSREFDGKAPQIFVGSGLALLQSISVLSSAERTISWVLLKSVGISEFKRHWIWLAECAATLWPNPAPFQFSLTAAVPSCSEAGVCCRHSTVLPSRTGILGDIEQLEQTLNLPAATMQGT